MRVFLNKIPEEILYSKIWGLHLIQHMSRAVKRSDFPYLSSKCNFVRDLFKVNDKNQLSFCSVEEMNTKFGYIPDTEIVSMRQHIRETLIQNNVKLEELSTSLPFRPAIFSLVNISKKGCGRWTNLKKGLWSTLNLRKREVGWETELGRIQGVPFWDRCYKNTSLIFFDNKIKWLQFQIVRGTLKTNRIVSKFIQSVDEKCSFCNLMIESISHLFWECPLIQAFIKDISELASGQNPAYRIENSLRSFIFGNSNRITDPNSVLSLYLKYYIWTTRCKQNNLNTRGFFRWFNKEANILRIAYQGSDLELLTNIVI